jgi:ClpP class serine protease
MITNKYVLEPGTLEKWHAFRDMESRARKGLSVELIDKIKTSAREAGADIPIYESRDDVAYVNIGGMLVARRSLSAGIAGVEETVYGDIEKSIKKAELSYTIKKIVLNINSPGGEWDGIEAAAEAIMRASKPVEAIVFTSAQSGGYYLASQAGKIFANTDGSLFGSIGVAAEIFDRTEEEGKKGIRRLIFTNSQSADKRPDLKTDEGAEVIQKELDALYEIFENRVVSGRGGKTGAAAIRELKGRSVTAQTALEIGLIDGIRNGGEPPKEGKKMGKLSDFLAENAEAKAEFDAQLAAKDGALSSSIALLNERLKKVLVLKGVKLSEKEEKTISGEMSLEDLALAEVADLRKTLSAPNDGALGVPAIAQTPAEQAYKGKKDPEAEAKAEEKIRAEAKKW